MSGNFTKPPINPEKTLAGIAVDPRTLERVIPESRRPDGTVRKQLKVRPGFTPQEDVKRFRGTRQTQHEATQLPKGHIIGWVPPTSASASTSQPMTKSAKKNAKRKEKKAEKKEVEVEKVKDSWEDSEGEGEGEGEAVASNEGKGAGVEGEAKADAETKEETTDAHTSDTPNQPVSPPSTTTSSASTPAPGSANAKPPRKKGGLADQLAGELSRLSVR